MPFTQVLPLCHLGVDRGTASSSNLESSYVFRPFSNLGSFGRMLDDAAVIGISTMI